MMKPTRRQGGRQQGGRDIDAKWRDADGVVCYWRFECKSHRGPRPVPLHEVCMHLLETDLADTVDLDCWCPVALKTEFHNAFTDVVSRFNARKLSHLWIELWTPKANCLHEVLECLPEHYSAMFSESPPVIEPQVRTARLANLRRAFDEASRRGRQRRERAAHLGRQAVAQVDEVRWSASDERAALLHVTTLTRLRERGFVEFARDCCAALVQDSGEGAFTKEVGYALHREWAECESALGNDGSYADQLELAGRFVAAEPRGIACLAMAEVVHERYQDAIGLAEGALRAQPALPLAARALAYALHRTGSDDKALETLQLLASVHAECAAAAGQIACEIERHDVSLDFYESALRLKDDAWYRCAIARALLFGVRSRVGRVPGWRITGEERKHLCRALSLCDGAVEEVRSLGNARRYQAAILILAELRCLLGTSESAVEALSWMPSAAGPAWHASRRMLLWVNLEAERVRDALSLMTSADWVDAGVDDVVLRARLLLMEDRPADAIASLSPSFDETGMASWPIDVIEVYLHAAHTLGKQAERERASAALRDGHPNNPHALLILSALHLRMGAVAEARQALEQAAQHIGPDTPHHVVHSLAHFSDRVGEHPRAASLYERLVTAFAPDAMVTTFACSLAKAKRYDDCIRLSSEVRALRAVPPELARIEAHCLDVGRDDPEAAIVVLSDALMASPNDIATRFEIARIEARLGRGSATEVALLADRAKTPREARAIGELFILCGDWARAAQYLSRALDTWPTDPDIRDSFLALSFSTWAESDLSLHPAAVGPETEVHYSLDGVEHTSRITSRPRGPSDLDPGSSLGQALSGMRAGESKTWRAGATEKLIRVKDVESIFTAQARALLKSTDVNPSRILTKIKVSGDYHEVLEIAEDRSRRAKSALGLYTGGRLTFAQLAHLLGDELHKAWGSIVGDRGPGLIADLDPVPAAFSERRGEHRRERVVIAPPAIFSIVDLGIEKLVGALFEPLVPNALVEYLRRILLQERSIFREGMAFLAKEGGQPSLRSPTAADIEAHISWLFRVLAFAESCGRVPLQRQFTPEEMAIEDNLGVETAVALRIACDLGILLYSDDAALAYHLTTARGGRSISTYRLLRLGMAEGELSPEDFTRQLVRLARQRFTSFPIRLEDLDLAFRLDGDLPGDHLDALLRYISMGRALKANASAVLAKFLTGLWGRVGSITWGASVEACCGALGRTWGRSAIMLMFSLIGRSQGSLWTPVQTQAKEVVTAWLMLHPIGE